MDSKSIQKLHQAKNDAMDKWQAAYERKQGIVDAEREFWAAFRAWRKAIEKQKESL